jgi:hypothetical protein
MQSARRPPVWPLVFLVIIAVIAGPVPTASASGRGWVVVCKPSHTGMNDPIVFPGSPGASHLHDFFGNTTTAAFSTYGSMLNGGTTCSSGVGDTAAYWTPALYQNGQKIEPLTGSSKGFRAYYRKNNLAEGVTLSTFPADLRLVAGNSHAMSPAENRRLGKDLYWGCSNNSTGKLAVPPVSCATGIISLHIGFPNCWDGVLTHGNDTAHVMYPHKGVCPAGFSIALPRVILRLEYPVAGTGSGEITLASGPTYTIHGDFWNTWQQSSLDGLVTNCLNANVSCGTFF